MGKNFSVLWQYLMWYLYGPSPKSITRVFNWFNCWVGLCTSSSQQGVKDKLCYLAFWGDPINIPWKIAKGRKVLSHSGCRSNVLHAPSTDLSVWVGSAPQAHIRVWNINFDIWILRGPYKYPLKNWQRTIKFFPTCGLSQRYFPGL